MDDKYYILIKRGSVASNTLAKLCRADYGQSPRALLTKDEVFQRIGGDDPKNYYIFDTLTSKKIQITKEIV